MPEINAKLEPTNTLSGTIMRTTSVDVPVQNGTIAVGGISADDYNDFKDAVVRSSNNESDIGNLTSRVENIATLPSGSTTADAELIDIRVGADGNTYPNAGTAVRTQVSELKQDLAYLDMFNSYNVYDYNPIMELGYLNSTTGEKVNANDYVRTKDKKPFLSNKITFDVPIGYDARIYFYNDDTLVRTTDWISGQVCHANYESTVNSYKLLFRPTSTASLSDFSDFKVTFNKMETMCLNLEKGNISVSNQLVYSASNSRMRTINPIKLKKGDFFRCVNTDYVYGLGVKLTQNGNYSWVTWRNIDYIATSDVEVVVLVRKSTETDFDSTTLPIAIGAIELHTSNYIELDANYFLSKQPHTKLCSILCGSDGYPKYDTKSKTVSFESDTIIIDSRFTGGYKQLTDANRSVTYTYGSSAFNVFYDMGAETLIAVPYNYDGSPSNTILIMSVRITSNSALVSCSCPVWVDELLCGNTEKRIVSNNAIKSVNHRGYSDVAPENTLIAFAMSKKHGFEYVETDVSWTSDGVAVCLHDSTVDRTSNGTGNIYDLTLAQVKALDFGLWKGTEYTGTTIPTFEEFIKFCKHIGLHPYIEIKVESTTTTERVKSLVDAVNRNGMINNCTFISASNSFLNDVVEKSKKPRIGFVVNSVTESNVAWCKTQIENGIDCFLDVYDGNVTSESMAMCANNYVPVECWTPYTMHDIDDYVTGYTTNKTLASNELYDWFINRIN